MRDRGLRIGELAELAATTPRAIRHYHSIGLLPEPERDASGYRRYGPEHLVRLVRIRRLRVLDLPLEQIASHLSGAPGDVRASLRSLADDLGTQIDELQALRQRVLDLASVEVQEPEELWSSELRRHGLLGEGRMLPAGEQAAVDLIDALHPEGVQGLIDRSSSLLADPTLTERLEPLLARFRALPDDDAAIEELARELASLLPRSEQAPPVDVETMERLLGDRFTPGQRRLLRRLRQILEEQA